MIKNMKIHRTEPGCSVYRKMFHWHSFQVHLLI